MARVFSYVKSILDPYSLEEKNEIEYRIELVRGKLKCERYDDYTGRDLWEDAEEYVRSTFESIIIALDSDVHHDDGERYLWLHLKLDTAKETIKTIVDALNEKYAADWRQYVRVPKLRQMIEEKFRNVQFLLQSVCEHQRQFGYDATQAAIAVYFNK
jgi:hypothetical protein